MRVCVCEKKRVVYASQADDPPWGAAMHFFFLFNECARRALHKAVSCCSRKFPLDVERI